jgi:hypothetical protein
MDFLLTHTMLERAVRRESYANKPGQDELMKQWNSMKTADKIGIFVRFVFEILLGVIAVRMTWACSGKNFVGVLMAILSFLAPHIAIPYHVMFAQASCSAYWV